jgi:hypothetical protein
MWEPVLFVLFNSSQKPNGFWGKKWYDEEWDTPRHTIFALSKNHITIIKL